MTVLFQNGVSVDRACELATIDLKSLGLRKVPSGELHGHMNKLGYVIMRKTKMDRYKAKIASQKLVIDDLQHAVGIEIGRMKQTLQSKIPVDLAKFKKGMEVCDIYRMKKRFSDKMRQQLSESGVTEYQMYLNEKFQELQLPDLEVLDAIVQFESFNSTIKALEVFQKFLEKSKEMYVFRTYKDVAKLNELIISVRKQITDLTESRNNLKHFLDGKE